MAVATYPGVHIQEVSSGVRSIAAASTSVAAFLGQAEKGVIGKAVKVFNFTEYQTLFGGFLNSSFLSHAVFQYFNNGGSQCYVVRVASEETETADISLNDRHASTPKVSVRISAKSPGAWGNSLAVVVRDGSNDPGNEFNLEIYQEAGDELTLLESFENLSMVPGASSFVDTAVAASRYVTVTADPDNGNLDHGRSVGSAGVKTPLEGSFTKMRVNVDGDGYQEIDLATAGADLSDAAGIATAIQSLVQGLAKQREKTAQTAFDLFTCTADPATEVLELVSGTEAASSSVQVAPAADPAEDASTALHLGLLNGGVESSGGAVRRPPSSAPGGSYHLGNNALALAVDSVTPGSEGDEEVSDTTFIAALSALDDLQDVSLIAMPGRGSEAVVSAGMSYCEIQRHLSDCFFIGDMPDDFDTIDEAKAFRAALSPKNSYGAIYLPWVKMLDPAGRSSEPILAPPSGFVAGIYARTDAQRGVWKAPAGTAAALTGAVGLAADFTDVQQGNLNPLNINVIRKFDAAGVVVWGARTITSDAEWNYVPVRRMANLLKVSIYGGIQWAVFEPNDSPLWAQLRLNVTAFMSNLFRQGAFQGATPAEAFFVKCDGETTTQADVDLGVVNLLVGFAPLKPAEFIVVKISQKAGQT